MYRPFGFILNGLIIIINFVGDVSFTSSELVKSKRSVCVDPFFNNRHNIVGYWSTMARSLQLINNPM